MIRQDESTRRSTAVLFVDTRDSAVGQTHTLFREGHLAAASLGILLMRYGFSVKLATTQMPPQRVAEESLLDALAGMTHHSSRALSTGLTRLRMVAASDTTLVVGASGPTELPIVARVGAMFGPKVGVFVHHDRARHLPPDRRLRSRGAPHRPGCPVPNWVGGRGAPTVEEIARRMARRADPTPGHQRLLGLAAVTACPWRRRSRSAACSPAGRPPRARGRGARVGDDRGLVRTPGCCWRRSRAWSASRSRSPGSSCRRRRGTASLRSGRCGPWALARVRRAAGARARGAHTRAPSP